MGEGTITIPAESPARSHIIKRPRLTKILDETEARVILLCAPAGYGKTTLAREWLATRSEPVAWYSGGKPMADVAVLSTGIAESLKGQLRTDFNVLPDQIRSLASRGLSPTVLAEAIAKAVPTPHHGILALDDCHYADSDEAEEFLSVLASHTSLRLLVTTRAHPRWVTGRMEVYQDAIAVGPDDLLFTDEEAHAVLGSEPSTRADAILAQAQGWPALIGLAAVQGRLIDPETKLLPADLYRFFAEDLFNRLTPGARDFLYWLALSGDRQLDVALSLASETTEGDFDEEPLSGWLSRPSRGISLHPLLRAFLVEKLRGLRENESLHRVLAIVPRLVERRAWDEALGVLENFTVNELVVSALTSALEELLGSGRVATLSRWVDLAQRRGLHEPIVLLAQAEVSLRQRDELRAQMLAERAARELPSGDFAARALSTAARAAHLREDAEAASRNSDMAARLAESNAVRVDALWIRFLTSMESEDGRADELLGELSGLMEPTPENYLRVAAARAYLALEARRDPREALRVLEGAEALLRETNDPLIRTNFLNSYVNSALQLARYEEALRLSDTEASIARDSGLDFVLDHSLIGRARAYTGLRELSAAQHAVRELDRRRDSATSFVVASSTVTKAKLRIALGDLRGGLLALRQTPPPDLAPSMRGELLAYRALIQAASGATAAAARLGRAALATSQCVEPVAVSQLAAAIRSLQDGGVDAARKTMSSVLASGYLDATVHACRAFPQLAESVVRIEKTADDLRALFVASRDVSLGRRIGLEIPRELDRREALSPREFEVYELLVQGRSNREIAKTLFISDSTAKVHVRHIFEKLGVRSRAEAAGLAAEVTLERRNLRRE